MADGGSRTLLANTAGIRVRTASFTASALLVLLAGALLVLASRAIVTLEAPAIQGVRVTIEPRRPPPPVSAIHRAPSSIAARGTPTLTPLAVGPDVMARVQSCLSPHVEDRPADCPQDIAPQDWRQSQQLPVGGDFNRPSPTNLDQAFTRAELNARAVPPPCQLGVHGAGAGVEYCQHIYPDPPPPSRSAEEVCEAGRIGPCHPPAFRESDVIHQRHTD
jgi:hypothetical protein